MSQGKPAWGQRPTTRKPAAGGAGSQAADLDKFVNGGKKDTVRLNVEIPKTLRARVKSQCAIEGREIKDVVTELLEKRFPDK
jgi:hypothetical protein